MKTLKSLSRREVIEATFATAATLVVQTRIAGAQPRPQLFIRDAGGPFTTAFRAAFYDPFEKATGCQVVNVASQAEPLAQIKAIVETRNYIWDVVHINIAGAEILNQQNLLENVKFNAAKYPDLMPEAVKPYWVGVDVYATVMAYRSDRLKGDAPSTWADFWNVTKFPGRRALRKNPTEVLELALLADGVKPADLYPLDVPRAFASLDRIKPHVAVWWAGGAQSSQLIQSGEVDLIAIWNARAQSVIDAGAPVKISWGQGLYSIEGWGIVKGTPRLDLATQFVEYCADADRQAVFTQGLSYGPTNLAAYKSVNPAKVAALPTHQPNLAQLRLTDDSWWSKNRGPIQEKFDAWLLQ